MVINNTMKKIGITGQVGFIGSHLYNTLNLKEDVELVAFKDEFFEDSTELEGFVKQCDTIVHLAAMNRHEDQNIIYETNISLVKALINTCKKTDSTPHIIFSSSLQEEKDNLYGKSKIEGRKLFEEWARNNNAKFTGLIIPNVFGPFGKPFYNSVVATFCYQVTHNEQPNIIEDGIVNLIYINELVDIFYSAINNNIENSNIIEYKVHHTSSKKVSEILQLLETYRDNYLKEGVIPNLENEFEKALYNTFICYIPKEHYPFIYTKHADDRGHFVEIAKVETKGQFSFSTTKPGITRGNHFHTRKAERFAVIKGKAQIQLRKIDSDEVITYKLDGENPSFVDMPIWYTHNIKNIGEEELITLFWINEPYNPENADTYFELVIRE